jgi:thioesterase domain-containing protein
LKPGEADWPPVFFVHGLGGTVADLFALARAVAYPGAVIGIQARGLSDEEAPHARVEAMAAEYLTKMKARQPRGPYHVCGYSFGGLVAFEIARRLRESGEEVGLVGLFDTLPNALRWPAPIWFDYVRLRTVRGFADAAAASARVWRRATGKSTVDLRKAPRGRVESERRLPALLPSAPGSILKVAASALVASARYRPGYYPGEVKLFVAVERDPALPLPDAIWERHARSLSIAPVAGGHLTMMSAANAEANAAALTRCLPAQ